MSCINLFIIYCIKNDWNIIGRIIKYIIIFEFIFYKNRKK